MGFDGDLLVIQREDHRVHSGSIVVNMGYPIDLMGISEIQYKNGEFSGICRFQTHRCKGDTGLLGDT